jgi:fucose 4-O-acetylase-like acetyltransferase
MKKRIQWLDLEKGFGILLVVSKHVVSSYHETGYWQNNHVLNFYSIFVVSFVMAMFMMMNGHLVSMKKSSGTKGRQVLRRFINYGIPYIIFSILWVTMKLLMSEYTNTKVTLLDLVQIPVYPISFLWFLYALMLMQMIQVFVPGESRTARILHVVLAAAGFFIQPYLAQALQGIRFPTVLSTTL